MKQEEMDIRFFSPSYNRPKTTSTDKIFSFVQLAVHDFEADAYLASRPAQPLAIIPDSLRGNIASVRNWILEKNQDADLVVMLDDDITHICRYDSPAKPRPLSPDDVQQFAAHALQMGIDAGAYLLGVNTIDGKGFYREYNPLSFLSPILGTFHAVRPSTPLRYDESLSLKEDYDYFIQHCNFHRKTLRFNHTHYICDHSNTRGGCAAYRNMKREKEQFAMLQTKWGSRIVQRDQNSRQLFDYNPVIKIPIKGA